MRLFNLFKHYRSFNCLVMEGLKQIAIYFWSSIVTFTLRAHFLKFWDFIVKLAESWTFWLFLKRLFFLRSFAFKRPFGYVWPSCFDLLLRWMIIITIFVWTTRRFFHEYYTNKANCHGVYTDNKVSVAPTKCCNKVWCQVLHSVSYLLHYWKHEECFYSIFWRKKIGYQTVSWWSWNRLCKTYSKT